MADEAKQALKKVKQGLTAKIQALQAQKQKLLDKKDLVQIDIDTLQAEKADITFVIDTYLGGD